MYKEVLRSIAGIDVFPIVSLCLFMVVFAIALVWAMRIDRARLTQYANLPLDDTDATGPGVERPAPERIPHRGATL